MLTVEVCIACPDRAWRIAVRLPAGATVGDALLAAMRDPAVDDGVVGLLTEAAAGAAPPGVHDMPVDASGRHCDAVQPARKAARIGTGVFGKSRPLDWLLREGDRVEVYRPLTVDPKVARRRRAQARGRSVSR